MKQNKWNKNSKKIFNLLKWGLIGAISFYLTSGCTSRHESNLKNYAPLTYEQKDSLFKDLNLGLKKYLNSAKVYVLKEEEFPINQKGHVHPEKFIMCLNKNKIDFALQLHESAHLAHSYLNKQGSKFFEEWEKTSNIKYGKKNAKYLYLESELWDVIWKDGTFGPKDGMLEPYSSYSIEEDIANSIEPLAYKISPDECNKIIKECNEKVVETKQKNSCVRGYARLYPLYFANPFDKRFQKKIDLLKKYEFLNEKEYKDLSSKLGVLYHLLADYKN